MKAVRTVSAIGAVAALVGGVAASERPVDAMTPDNQDHNVCRTSSYSYLVTAYDSGVAELQTLPGWNTTLHPGNCADAKMYDGAYSSGWVGNTICESWSWWNPGACDNMKVRLNRTQLGTDAGKWKSTGCHELGHTVDLPHNWRTSSCMYTDSGAFPLSFDATDDSEALFTWAFA